MGCQVWKDWIIFGEIELFMRATIVIIILLFSINVIPLNHIVQGVLAFSVTISLILYLMRDLSLKIRKYYD